MWPTFFRNFFPMSKNNFFLLQFSFCGEGENAAPKWILPQKKIRISDSLILLKNTHWTENFEKKCILGRKNCSNVSPIWVKFFWSKICLKIFFFLYRIRVVFIPWILLSFYLVLTKFRTPENGFQKVASFQIRFGTFAKLDVSFSFSND